MLEILRRSNGICEDGNRVDVSDEQPFIRIAWKIETIGVQVA